MRCVVTGASGFVGSWLVRALVSQGHDVLGVVRSTSNLARLSDTKNRIALTDSSLDEIGSILEDCRQFQPDTFFHLAWWGGNSRKFVNDPAQVYQNVPGSLDLVRIASECGCRCFVFLGSCIEYGKYQIPVCETDPLAPENLYGSAKYGTELLSKALCDSYGMRSCGVRLFWAYGPMDDELRMVPSVISQLLKRECPSLTAGEQLWDFLYIEDAVQALITLAQSEHASGAYNLGSGQPVAIRQVVETIRDFIDPKLPLALGAIPYSPNQVMHLQADISRLLELGWRPNTTLIDGLRKTVEYYKSEYLRAAITR